jgi:hypothetical protein
MNRSYSKIRHIQESNQRLENRLLNEQDGVDSIPCIEKEFRFPVYKITNKNILDKVRLSPSVKPVLSKGNIILYNTSRVSVPDNKWGDVQLYENGLKIGSSYTLDKTELGSVIYNLVEKSYVAQDGDNHKIGWVMCNNDLYIYDIVGEQV